MLKSVANTFNVVAKSTCTKTAQKISFSRNLSVSSSRVVKFQEYGQPDKVLKMVNEDLPSKLSPNQVLVKILAAPINPMDINIVEGTYGAPGDAANKLQLPAVGGSEGVGQVLEVGSSVHGISVKDRVIPAKSGLGTWRDYAVYNAEDLQTVPSDIPTEYAATIGVNPATAYRLLEDANLKSGDVIIQNGANSTVGLAVIQLAKKKGIKTINIIRGARNDFDTLVERLKALGGYMVVSDQYLFGPQFKRLMSDMDAPKLALNCVGGETATEMIRLLGPKGKMITYGAMSRKPFHVPTSHLLFKEIELKGFWLNRWYNDHSKEEKEKMFKELYSLVRDEQIKLWIEKYNFTQFDQVLPKLKESQRGRKILLNMEGK